MTDKRTAEITALLDADTWLDRDGTDWCFEIYPDYRDGFSKETIRKILESEYPDVEFKYTLYSSYLDYQWSIRDEIEERVSSEVDLDDEEGEELSEFLLDHVIFSFPEDHYLKQEVLVDIFLDTGDANYDWTLNTIAPAWGGETEEINEKSSLLWLARQQGYSKEQLQDWLWNEESKTDSLFLKSVYQELANCGSSINALIFLVKMTLRDAIRLQQMIRSGEGTITIRKDAIAGLFDSWGGGGSVLALDLEKNVELPVQFIHSALPDGSHGRYSSVEDVYGMCRSAWRESIILPEQADS